MTDIIYDFISTGVDLLLIGAVLSAMLVMLRGSNQLTKMISEQDATAQEFDYYLQYHAYDNQDGLATADALSAIAGYRFELYVCIKDGSNYYVNDIETGKYYKISDTIVDKKVSQIKSMISSGTKLTYKELTTAVTTGAKFKARLLSVKNDKLIFEDFSRNTLVLGIYFEKVP